MKHMNVEQILSGLADGTPEQKVGCLEEFRTQFEAVMSATAGLLREDGAQFRAERVIALAFGARRIFGEVFRMAPAGSEAQVLAALILLHFGSRDAVGALTRVVGSSNEYRFIVAGQLARLGLDEVREPILQCLRDLSVNDVEEVKGYLAAWGATGEPLPKDLSGKFTAADVSPDLHLAMKAIRKE